MAPAWLCSSFIRDVYQHAESTESPSLGGPWFSRKGKGSIFFDESDTMSYSRVWRAWSRTTAPPETSRERPWRHSYKMLSLPHSTCRLLLRRGCLREAPEDSREGAPSQADGGSAAYSCYVPVQGLSAEGLPMTVGKVAARDERPASAQTRVAKPAEPTG